MVDIADEVFLAYATKDGNLDELLKGIKDKKIMTFEKQLPPSITPDEKDGQAIKEW